ncbi:MAG: 7-cyano-7-deazaguanine synthase QueC [Woeseiaceae bacterium]
MPQDEKKALVVLSGGQDSTTCLYWAIDRFGSDNVSTISFDYGQRHRIEVECAARVAEHAAVSNVCLPIDTFAALGGDALTDEDIEVESTMSPDERLPNTFVPGRNLVFLTFAAAYAYQRGIADLVTGVAETDYSGYPDCREETIRALQRALRLGMESEFAIHTPLMHLSKRETVELAVHLGALPAMALTHTCYKGKRPPCGDCPACELRARGFAEAGIDDPLLKVR